MDDALRLADLPPGKFAVGQPVRRNEDPKLLRGEGRYTDDLNRPGQAYAVMVRSRHAHGVIRRIDADEARAMPGVLGIFTGRDLAEAGFGALNGGPQMAALVNRDGRPMMAPDWVALPQDKVRFVGEPVAIVVAETAPEARDAAEAVNVEVDVLPAMTDAASAVAPGAPLLYDAAPGNVVLDYHFGPKEAVAQAFAGASHVTRLGLVNNRIVVNAMEPRASVSEFDPATGRWTIRIGCQGVVPVRNGLAGRILKVPTEQVRILTGNVGGSFGMKGVAAEDVAALYAARALGRPVKWTADRLESFLSDTQGRDHEITGELALDADGRFLAVRLSGYGNIGGAVGPFSAMIATIGLTRNVVSVYRTPLIEVDVKCVVTNTTPIGAYRGAGRPEANYFMERLVEAAARETGIDRVALRRLNHIRPEAIPFTTPVNTVYDSGDFTAILDQALDLADWAGFEARRMASLASGKLRGRGIGQYLEVTAPAGNELADIRFDPDGGVTLYSGTLDYGQGHWTPFAQVLADKLGLPFELIRLNQSDSDQMATGGMTGGSKSLMSAGTAILEAGDKVIAQGTAIAAHVLETATADIEFGAGRFTVVGTDRSVGLLELAAQLRAGLALPPDLPQALDAKSMAGPGASAYPNGCHVVEVEIDPDTGATELLRYTSVNDFGTLINPLLVEGQVHGGIVQGIGQALMERVVYDAEGQPLAGSFMDYALPRAEDVISFGFVSHPVPAKTNRLGAKGCGEAGCAGALPGVMNAVADALAAVGVRHIDMPATPHRIWQAIQAARVG